MGPCGFFWDLDGTLVDSYPAIVPVAKELCDELGLGYSAEYIYAYACRSSIGALLEEAAEKLGCNASGLKSRFNARNDRAIDAIRPIPHAKETLAALARAGHRHFMYTHRGASCGAILERTGLAPYFTEVLTALDGFPRKPAPDAILYLMGRHRLAPERCWYIGDRSLDVLAAENAGIRSVLLYPPGSPTEKTGRETLVIEDLSQLPDLIGR